MTNREKLMQLHRDHPELTYVKIAEVLGVSYSAVKSWILHDGAEAHRGMPDDRLDQLEAYVIIGKIETILNNNETI